MATRDRANELGFSMEDLTRILRRRRYWLAVPSVVGVIGALALALGLPPTYEAVSTLLVEPRAIPETLVQTTVVAETETRYGQLRLQILARDNLSAVIDEFHLYPELSLPREELVAQMREAISIEPLPPAIIDPRKPQILESFRIAFRGENRRVVADVANRLTRDFISAHLADRERQAKGAREFIENELLKSRGERVRLQKQITEFKEEHHGELPEQLALNSAHLERLRRDLRKMSGEQAAAKAQVVGIRTQLDELQAVASRDTNDPANRKQALELVLNAHRSRGKTDRHPDVMQTQAEIAALDEMIQEAVRSDTRPSSPAMQVLQRDLRANQVQARVLGEEIKQLALEIAQYEAQIQNTPRRAAALDQLVSTAGNLGDSIRMLQLKQVDAEMGHTIELAQKGEKFRVVEWAVRPDSPISPNRPLWFVVGSMLGVLAGLALLILRELSDASFRSLQELQQAIALPVLASVPRIRLAGELAVRRVRLRRLGISSAVIVVLILGGTLAFYV